MIEYKDFEVWFVTGSQDLYGEATLKKVAEHSREMAEWMTTVGQIAGEGGLQTGGDKPRCNHLSLPGSQQHPQLPRFDHLDAYLFPGQNVDRRIAHPFQTFRAPAYPI